VTSFFEIKVCVFLENDKTDLHQTFFQDLGENTYSLKPELKALPRPLRSAGGGERQRWRFLKICFYLIAESSVFIFSNYAFRLTLIGRKRQYEGKHVCSGYL